jgi:hypothetical protein
MKTQLNPPLSNGLKKLLFPNDYAILSGFPEQKMDFKANG